MGVDRIQQFNHSGRRHIRGHGRKVDQIAKQNAGRVVMIGDGPLLDLKRICDRLRQNVQQQRFGSFSFLREKFQCMVLLTLELVDRLIKIHEITMTMYVFSKTTFRETFAGLFTSGSRMLNRTTSPSNARNQFLIWR